MHQFDGDGCAGGEFRILAGSGLGGHLDQSGPQSFASVHHAIAHRDGKLWGYAWFYQPPVQVFAAPPGVRGKQVAEVCYCSVVCHKVAFSSGQLVAG